MSLRITAVALFASGLVSHLAFADQPAPQQQPQQQYEQAPNYNPGPPVGYQRPPPVDQGCNTCGGYDPDDGPAFNPSTQYYCNGGCGPVQLPNSYVILQPVLPPPPPPPVYYSAPIYPQPYYGNGFVGGYRGGYFGGGVHGRYATTPAPRFFHRMSSTGCEIQRGNNGEVALLSQDGQVLFRNSSSNAEALAEYVKTNIYEAKTLLCGQINTEAIKNQPLDI